MSDLKTMKQSPPEGVSASPMSEEQIVGTAAYPRERNNWILCDACDEARGGPEGARSEARPLGRLQAGPRRHDCAMLIKAHKMIEEREAREAQANSLSTPPPPSARGGAAGPPAGACRPGDDGDPDTSPVHHHSSGESTGPSRSRS